MRVYAVTGLYRWQLKKKISSHNLYDRTEDAIRKLKDEEKRKFKEAEWKKVMAKEQNAYEGTIPNGTSSGIPNANRLQATARRHWWRKKRADGIPNSNDGSYWECFV